MQNTLKWSIIGGDERFVRMTSMFTDRRYSVRTAFLPDIPGVSSVDFADAVGTADIIVLPLPAAVDGSHLNVSNTYLKSTSLEITQILTLYELQIKLQKGQIVFGGMLPAWFIRRCEENGIKAVDYFTSEQLTVHNVIPTVEGCIQLLLSKTTTTLHGMSILVTGYGRIGKVLCEYLKNMGVHVTCAARNPTDFAWMQIHSIPAISYEKLPATMKTFDAVVNTVPNLVINESLLQKSRQDCLFIDLASKPGGIDFDAASQLGRQTIHALSLPGKIAPQSAAKYIFDTIMMLSAQL